MPRGTPRANRGQPVLDGIVAADVPAALPGLPREFRTAFYLTDTEDFSYREAAEIMGRPMGTGHLTAAPRSP